MASSLLALLLLPLAATAQRTRSQTSWGQCGGSGFSGPTACPADFYCTVGNPFYWQCVPKPGSPDEPIAGAPGIPDVPIQTTSFETVITVTNTAPAQTPGPSEVVITTFITFLTPKPESTAIFTAPPPDSSTFVPDEPITFKPVNPRNEIPPRWITAPAKQAPKASDV